MKDEQNWCITPLKAKGRWCVRIPMPTGGRLYVGCAASRREAEKIRDKAFMKHWGRIPSREEM